MPDMAENTEGKRKFALWIRESSLEQVRKWYKADDCSSQSEFIEKAIHFYIGYAEYQLGKIYYFGNGIRADREKGLEYLVQSAAHGNMYAENLLRVIRQQHIRGAASLIAQLGRIFQEKEQQDRVRHQQPDRKQRRQIDEKKQALGIRD